MASSSPPDAEHESEGPVVLQCARCLSILSDTLSYYVTSDASRQTVTMSNARCVVVAEEQLLSQNGWDSGCAFRLLSCKECQSPLGRCYISTTRQHLDLQDNFTFATAALVSYQLGSLEAAAAEQQKQGQAHGGGVQAMPPGEAVLRSRIASEPDSQSRVQASDDIISGRPSEDAITARACQGAPSTSNVTISTREEELSSAVTELDAHVEKLTTAANQVTSAQRRMESEVAHVKTEYHAVRRTMIDFDAQLAKMENLFLVWDERMTQLESQRQATCRMEERIAALEEELSRQQGLTESREDPDSDHPVPNSSDENLDDKLGPAASSPLATRAMRLRSKRLRGT